ncbi:MAG TPA: adenylyl-sulfate kinase [Xanthobacteraceae bacterium]|nr:adenylyl-sulfate kinase [Xanthobacteraceae bacterium]
MNKILIMGLPTAGKTTLAKALAPRLNAVHFNADEVRNNINRELTFSETDRIEHARRMGWLCDQVVKAGCFAIADFICPTPAARAAFAAGGAPFVVWVDRIKSGPYADTNRMFVPPEDVHLRVSSDGSPEYWAGEVMRLLRPIFDPRRPTALFLGRYQPFHDGHKALIIEGLQRVGQACIAVRNTQGIDENNPSDFEHVRARIEQGLEEFQGRFVVVSVPNITDVLYGRDVGDTIERIDLDTAIEGVSTTEARKKLTAR